MIRHAVLALALPILTLPVAMIEPSLETLLIPAISAPSLKKPGLPAAGLAAIPLPAITVRAEKKHSAAFLAQANPQPKHYFAVNRHAPAPAALDNGDHFVAT